ncbi:MAG: tRNA preQ1(34) S-adenosylmethionine ribosyltransferase-isomerase QueA [Acidimicrobiales bacterium]|nr:tRNA preQ1(34) S-adenosylmethionine ribosyltransferase-isomerase QueA [Acidimicrobiales bacterium]
MDIRGFDYELPVEAIAQEPLARRDDARLLVDRGPGSEPEHRHVRDLADLLDPGDVLVVNTTRVLPARLSLVKSTGGAAEVLLLDRIDHDTWEALVRPGRRLPPGTVLTPPPAPGQTVGAQADLVVTVGDDLGEGRRLVTLAADGEVLRALDRHGRMPLPPYITTPLAEPERYQTVYAERPASAAAPTAGLHLTPELLDRLASAGVTRADVELVVGLGTFRPIAVDDVADHVMHSESYRVPVATLEACAAARRAGGRVVAVGTTAVRALESAAATGELEGRTDLYIRRPYPWAVVDRLLTNFHLPRSSLLVMIDAFVGPRWRDLYVEALAYDYRFLSFGDAMLLSRSEGSG